MVELCSKGVHLKKVISPKRSFLPAGPSDDARKRNIRSLRQHLNGLRKRKLLVEHDELVDPATGTTGKALEDLLDW